MTPPSIFEFTRFSDYFAAHYRARKRLDGSYSFRRLAQKAGLSSPSLLAMIAQGDRVPTQSCLLKLVRALDLKKNESDYALALVGSERARSDEESRHFERKLLALRPQAVRAKTRLDLDAFDLISRWHHLAILEMTELDPFESDPAWISRRLGGLGVREVKEAIDRLLRLGLLARDPDGRLRKTSGGAEAVPGAPSRAIRQFHRAHLKNAEAALERQTIRERLFQAHTISIDPARLEEVERLYQQFLKEVDQLFESGPKHETYHLAFQCFRLTEKTRKS